MTPGPPPALPPARERRRLRETSGLTRTQVAARLGVPRETVRSWETGRTKPRGRHREAYAKLLSELAAAERPRVQAEAEGEDALAAAAPGPPDVRAPGAKAPDVRAAGAEAAGAGAAYEVPAYEVPAYEMPAYEMPSSGIPAYETPVPEESTGGGPPAPEAGGAGLSGAAVGAARPLTPAQAFDALYAFCAPALVRQAYLLTGRRALARESVERAFQTAWEHWPGVARDPDPASWVRAVAYEYALSPWHRFRRGHRRPEPPPADAADRALLGVLLALPPRRRRTLLLYDGVGLDLPETAAETEASTPAAAHRLMRAREAVAARLPDLADPGELHRRLAELASAEQDRLRAAEPPRVRWSSERRTRLLTRAAITFTAVLIGTTALALRSAPTRYEPPVPPGATVGGIPPRLAPGPLSEKERKLRAELRARLTSGPERLIPLPG